MAWNFRSQESSTTKSPAQVGYLYFIENWPNEIALTSQLAEFIVLKKMPRGVGMAEPGHNGHCAPCVNPDRSGRTPERVVNQLSAWP